MFKKLRLLCAALMVAVSLMALPVAASAFSTCGGNPYIKVYEDTYKNGISKIFCYGSYANLANYAVNTSNCISTFSNGTWNDCISSWEVAGTAIAHACLYTDSYYGGSKEAALVNQVGVLYNDRYSSIRFRAPGAAC